MFAARTISPGYHPFLELGTPVLSTSNYRYITFASEAIKIRGAQQARISSLGSIAKKAQTQNMNGQESLGLENLDLENDEAFSCHFKTRAELWSENAITPAHDDRIQSCYHSQAWSAPAVPFCEALSISALGISPEVASRGLPTSEISFKSHRHHLNVSSNRPPQIANYPNCRVSSDDIQCNPGQVLSREGSSMTPEYTPDERFTSVNGSLKSSNLFHTAGAKPPAKNFSPLEDGALSLGSFLRKSQSDAIYRGSLTHPFNTVHRDLKTDAHTEPPTQGCCIGSDPFEVQKNNSRVSKTKKKHNTNLTQGTQTIRSGAAPKWFRKGKLPHLPAPVPTNDYITLSHAIPTLAKIPQHLLLVLDLNGTLLYRSRASAAYTPRPCLYPFLQYAFANHSVLIWSSARPHNVNRYCARLLAPEQRCKLLGEWSRDNLELTPAQYRERVTVYKRLDRIWDNELLQITHPAFEQGERWNQCNTLLIDDSTLKASAQPFSHVEIPEFSKSNGEEEGDGKDVLLQIVDYLEEVRRWSNVSAFVREHRFKIHSGKKWNNRSIRGHVRSQSFDSDKGGVKL